MTPCILELQVKRDYLRNHLLISFITLDFNLKINYRYRFHFL